MWRRFKQGQDISYASLFRRRLAYDMMHHHVRLAEREESLGLSCSRHLGILGGPERFLFLNPSGTRNRLKSPHCRYCDKKSAYSCACSPFVGEGMISRAAMEICSNRQEGRRMMRHKAREIPPRKRMKATRQDWTSKTPSSTKSASDSAKESGRNA